MDEIKLDEENSKKEEEDNLNLLSTFLLNYLNIFFSYFLF